MIGLLRATVGLGDARTRRFLAAIAVYAIAEGAAYGLLIPLLTALFTERYAEAGRRLIPLALVVVVGWIAQHENERQALGLAATWRRRLYDRIGRRLVRLPLGWFDTDRSGSLPRLVGSDTGRVAGLVFAAQALIGALLTPATVLVFLLVADPWMALAALVAVPVVLAVFAAARRLTDRTEAAHDAAAAEAGARLLEFARAQPVLRATGRSAAGRAALDEAQAAEHRAARGEILGALPTQYLGRLTVQLAFTAVVVTGVLLVTVGDVAPATAVALVVVGISFLRPFEVIAGAASSLRASRAALDRVATLLTEPALPEPAAPRRPASSAVELDGVRFGYPGGPAVLDGLTLQLRPDRTTALVGTSGAGKTTVLKLVSRFFDVDAGAVRIGGVDVREIAAGELLATVSVVFQDVRLLDTTIAENIRLGHPDATEADVREAARRAQLLPVVDRLPGGWDARVGEGGRLLSGGERQRVAIARALCKDAAVVLLDEPTSALDAENAAAVGAALTELVAGRTVLVIAHQLATIARADHVAVLSGGRIAEEGTHPDLLARGGRYAALWRERERAAGWRLT